ncbi:MAG: PDDEXK nuclease domain-containing protein [Candidatus Woesearchaeota archaeon]
MKLEDYSRLVQNIRDIFENGRRNAYYSVNNILVRTYWEIGKRIVEYEQGGKGKAAYGKKLLERLSNDLLSRYTKGFSKTNLKYMRLLYLKHGKGQTLSDQLSWSHYVEILSVKDDVERSFYEKECTNSSWSVRELRRQIGSALFYRLALSRDKKGVKELEKKGQIIDKASDLIKDPYVLDFLDLEKSAKYTETELEQEIINHLEQFILELGKGFMFVDRQKRITLGGEHFFLDLVFYNRILRCFVIIELKIGKMTHKDLGQLQMYVNYYDRDIISEEENFTVGILLCADKNKAIVEYTLPKGNKQIYASDYKICLPDKRMLEKKLREVIKEDKKND